MVGEREEEVAHRLAAVLHVTTGLQQPASAAGEEHGEIVVAVAVGVGVAATVDDARVVQDRIPVDVAGLFEVLQLARDLILGRRFWFKKKGFKF